ncbi:hypothetical protein OIU76_019844 [Salix suchowensis]|nr:hypothetical protein OIU76_019844 [Salix suchowensis]
MLFRKILCSSTKQEYLKNESKIQGRISCEQNHLTSSAKEKPVTIKVLKGSNACCCIHGNVTIRSVPINMPKLPNKD